MPNNRLDPSKLRVDPVVRNFFELVRDSAWTYQVIADRSGVSRETIARWQTSASPSLSTFIAAANTLGHDVVLKKR
tara:strand:- start:47 stop:274 length:228 start_codon:yes stop_codon:yes gene_type:complete